MARTAEAVADAAARYDRTAKLGVPIRMWP